MAVAAGVRCLIRLLPLFSIICLSQDVIRRRSRALNQARLWTAFVCWLRTTSNTLRFATAALTAKCTHAQAEFVRGEEHARQLHELLLRAHQLQQSIPSTLVGAATELQIMLRDGATELQQVQTGPFSPRSRVALSPSGTPPKNQQLLQGAY